MERWIPVTEQMPRDDLYVLISDARGTVDIAYRKPLRNGKPAWHFEESGWAVTDDETNADRVTAWMPLPEAYKEAK